jgi:hypothetical protein
LEIWVELVVTDSEKRVMQEKRRMEASLSYRVTAGFCNELREQRFERLRPEALGGEKPGRSR